MGGNGNAYLDPYNSPDCNKSFNDGSNSERDTELPLTTSKNAGWILKLSVPPIIKAFATKRPKMNADKILSSFALSVDVINGKNVLEDSKR